jgi:hypothetical protein
MSHYGFLNMKRMFKRQRLTVVEEEEETTHYFPLKFFLTFALALKHFTPFLAHEEALNLQLLAPNFLKDRFLTPKMTRRLKFRLRCTESLQLQPHLNLSTISCASDFVVDAAVFLSYQLKDLVYHHQCVLKEREADVVPHADTCGYFHEEHMKILYAIFQFNERLERFMNKISGLYFWNAPETVVAVVKHYFNGLKIWISPLLVDYAFPHNRVCTCAITDPVRRRYEAAMAWLRDAPMPSHMVCTDSLYGVFKANGGRFTLHEQHLGRLIAIPPPQIFSSYRSVSHLSPLQLYDFQSPITAMLKYHDEFECDSDETTQEFIEEPMSGED